MLHCASAASAGSMYCTKPKPRDSLQEYHDTTSGKNMRKTGDQFFRLSMIGMGMKMTGGLINYNFPSLAAGLEII
jgi:hypothetical protein